MLSLSLICVVAATSPDGGQSSEWLSLPTDAAMKVRRDTDWAGTTEQSGFATLTVFLADGGTSAATDRINASFAQLGLPDEGKTRAVLLEERRRAYTVDNVQGDTAVTMNLTFAHGPFLQVRICSEFMSTYPSMNCTLDYRRVDTGETWTWLDAVPRARRKAFLDACSALLAPRLREHLAKDENARELASSFDTRCTDAGFNRATLTKNGELEFAIATGLPHVAQGTNATFTVPRDEFLRWLDARAPLALALRRAMLKAR